MSGFFASASSYDRFMGRFSKQLAAPFLDFVEAPAATSALDVGCGPGALTEVLRERVGTVSAVDPSPAFVDAVRAALPDVDTHVASAETLPFADGVFDLTVAQLVVHFMPDPVAGVAGMARVTRPGGVVAANAWDFAGGRGPLGVFERAALDLDPDAPTERELVGAGAGDLARVFGAAGIVDVRTGSITIGLEFATFEDWWEPFGLGVGPAGAYVASLGGEARTALSDRARELVGATPFRIDATAWAAVGTVPDDAGAGS
ncbi:class I SAM-dependent methyltransferase [Curtobacterium pusillum]|uniref:class I SAM-dependent methyltransferase n=1 Tax=Curtobacterium pusillum TaxID=69373 RepID=UPI0011A933B5|nr:class I SAM-dependent methyltransferase [Curtobacterium pusillum]